MEYSLTQIVINGGEYTGFVDNMGSFGVYVDSPGTYKLEVINMNWHFEPVIVEVHQEEVSPGKHCKAFLYSMKSGKDYRLMYPLQLDPLSRNQYFEIEPPFDPTVYLKNPFVMMVGMTFLMSYMTKNMDKGEMEKMTDMQKD